MKSFIKHHPIVSFFLLTYALAWIVWIPAVSVWRLKFAPDRFPWWFFPAYLIGVWSPTLAAFIITGVLVLRTNGKTLSLSSPGS